MLLKKLILESMCNYDFILFSKGAKFCEAVKSGSIFVLAKKTFFPCELKTDIFNCKVMMTSSTPYDPHTGLEIDRAKYHVFTFTSVTNKQICVEKMVFIYV